MLKGYHQSSVYTNSLIIPLCFAAASILGFVIHLIARVEPVRRLFRRNGTVPNSEESAAPVHPENLVQELNAHIGSHGGPLIYTHMLIRLVGTLALLGLSITSLILDEVRRNGKQGLELLEGQEDIVDSLGKWGKKHPKKKYGTHYTKREWLEAAMCLTFVRIPFSPH